MDDGDACHRIGAGSADHDVIQHVHQVGDAGLEHDRESDHHGSLYEFSVECESE